MKIIKINDNIKINIEMIYSLEKYDNQNDIDEWINNYNIYLDEYTKNPPLLPINEEELFQPVFGESIDENKMKLYATELSKYIISIIGEKPTYSVTYFIILCTGLKINIDKSIYESINNYLEKYIDK